MTTPGRSGLILDEPLVFERSRPGRPGLPVEPADVPPVDPAELLGAAFREDIEDFPELSEIDDCHILFISESESQRLREVFWRSEGKPILTVGESRRFLDSGGMIRFKVVGRRVRFEIDQSAAKQAGLEVSSKLMNLSARGSGP